MAIQHVVRDGAGKAGQRLYWWLEVEDGDLVLKCENDPTVDGWNVFSVTPEGTGRLHGCLEKKTGLQLNKEEQIVLVLEK